MKVLNNQLDLESFYDRLAGSPGRLLMLDYDGTLAPFTADRDDALPYPEISDVLKQLFAGPATRVVVISGRSVDNLCKLFHFDILPELWGCHGLERRTPDGNYGVIKLPDEVTVGLAELYSWIGQSPLVDICEFKPSGAAFHWRGLEQSKADEIRETVLGRWQSAAEASSLEIHDFDGGIEIRVSGTNKAIPVKTLIDEAEDESILAYLGDDLTDEDAFQALKGVGLSVLVRDSLRETAADIWLAPPGELRDFLQRWL